MLAVVALAGTAEAREVIRDIEDDIANGTPLTRFTRAVQLAREVGAITDENAFGLIDVMTECAFQGMIADDPVLSALEAEIAAIKRANGLEDDEDYCIDEGPPDWLALNRLWDRRMDALRVTLFRRVGEPGMAAMMLLRVDEFDERVARARSELFALREEADDPFGLSVEDY